MARLLNPLAHSLSLENAMQFILAGKSTFTFRSVKTGKHYTYNVQLSSTGNSAYVKAFTGTDNTQDYQYIGYITVRTKHFTYGAKKSKISHDAPIVKAFEFSYNQLKDNKINSKLEFYHTNRCCRCGKPLTTPESVLSGIGPKCATF